MWTVSSKADFIITLSDNIGRNMSFKTVMDSIDLRRTIMEYSGIVQMPSFKVSEDKVVPVTFLPSKTPRICGILSSVGANLRSLNKEWKLFVDQYVEEVSMEMHGLLEKDFWHLRFSQAHPSQLTEQKTIELMFRVMKTVTWNSQNDEVLKWETLTTHEPCSFFIPTDPNPYDWMQDQPAYLWLSFFPQKNITDKCLYNMNHLSLFSNLANRSNQWFRLIHFETKISRTVVHIIGPNYHKSFVRPSYVHIGKIVWAFQDCKMQIEINIHKNLSDRKIILKSVGLIFSIFIAIVVTKIVSMQLFPDNSRV